MLYLQYALSFCQIVLSLSLFRSSLSPSLSVFLSFSVFTLSLSPSLLVFLSFSVFSLSITFCLPSLFFCLLSLFLYSIYLFRFSLSLSLFFGLPSFCLRLIIISFILSLLFVKASRFSFILAACQLYKYCCSELLDMSLVLDIVALCLFLTTVTANSRTREL